MTSMVISVDCPSWVGQKVRYVLFCKVKDTFFIFTSNFVGSVILVTASSVLMCVV